MRRRAGSRTAPLVAVLTLAAGLAGCVERGDFGRVAPSAWNGALDTVGSLSATLREEAVSPYALTDDERELRERAWRFLTPQGAAPVFTRELADLTVLRVLPADWHPTDPADYHAGLMAEPFRSPASRYRRVSDDVVADGRLLGPFAAVAARVAEADAARLRGLPLARTLSEDDVSAARARVAENRGLVAWVRREARARAAAYRYALEHLFAEAPQREAIAPERALAGLHERITHLEN